MKKLSSYDKQILRWIFEEARKMQGAYLGDEYESGIRKIDRLEATLFKTFQSHADTTRHDEHQDA